MATKKLEDILSSYNFRTQAEKLAFAFGWNAATESAEALKPSHNTARAEICPVTAMSCSHAKVQVVCKLEGSCHHKGQGKLSPVA